jgi:hypothetical protein
MCIDRIFVKLIVGLLLLALVGTLYGCATIAPDVLTIDASHTEHEWGSSGYDYGKDTAGVAQHWKRGNFSLDVAEYGQQCKDGWRPEWSARTSYAIPLK